ncbi:MAG: hypothetical protein LC778_19820 [Acidobacteria bacterium]|nr:hypothetical protein [Acidobacteriota bacterium]
MTAFLIPDLLDVNYFHPKEVSMKKVFLVLFVFSLLSLVVSAEDSQEFEIIEVDLGPVNVGSYLPEFVMNRSSVLPKLWVNSNGYTSLSAPDSATLACWQTYDHYYQKNSLIYFGAVITNAEPTVQKFTLIWEIKGLNKIIKTVQPKQMPAARLVAYFIRKSLGTTRGDFTVTTSIFKATPGVAAPGLLVHTLTTSFYVHELI